MTHYINKYIKFILIALLALLLNSANSEALVSGECSNCHTMHNSYAGLNMRLGLAGVTGAGTSECYDCHSELRNILLRWDCIGCHAQGLISGNNIDDNMPQVAHTGGSDLAGGNFFHIFTGDDLNGHNVHGFDNDFLGPDGNHGNNPPGWDADFDPSTGDYLPGPSPTGQIMCAGEYGCHGDREVVSQNLAIKGAHHTNDSALQYGASFNEGLQGSSVGTSYRYLLGVKGAEDSDWEASKGINDHNEYRGLTFDVGRTSQAWGDIESMSTFCSECHGVFHSGPGLESADTNVWIRHPTDAIMPNQSPFTSYTEYDLVAPVARQSITAATAQASNVVTPGTDIVFCLSCHRSHASPYQSMLRWDYDICNSVDDPGKNNCGCYTCHSTY